MAPNPPHATSPDVSTTTTTGAPPAHGGCASDAVRSAADACASVAKAGDTARAIADATRILSDHPQCGAAHQCIGIASFLSGDTARAADSFRRAAADDPSDPWHHANLGIARYYLGDHAGAERPLLRALEMAPTMDAPVQMLGEVYAKLGLADKGMNHYASVLAADDAATTMGHSGRAPLARRTRGRVAYALHQLLVNNGRVEDARDLLLREAANRSPELTLAYVCDLVPVVPRSTQHILESRSQLQAAAADTLARIESGDLSIPDDTSPLDVGSGMSYYIAYHGLNDVGIRESLVQLWRSAFPRLTRNHMASLGDADACADTDADSQVDAAPATSDDPVFRRDAAAAFVDGGAHRAPWLPPPLLSRRIRIGFVSSFFHFHSVGKMINRLVGALPRDLFHVSVFLFPHDTDFASAGVAAAADEVVYLHLGSGWSEIERNREAIAAARLDVLVFPELGMHAPTRVLAFSRMAPVQVVTHGNSVTSGHRDSVDYYVSFDDIEVPGADAHFAEQLVRLNSFHSAFMWAVPQPLPQPARRRPRATDAGASALLAATVQWLDSARVDGRGEAQGQHRDDRDGISAAELLAVNTGADGAAGTKAAAQEVAAQCDRMRVVLCPQTPPKLHPSFDGVLLDVLRQDPCALLVMTRPDKSPWGALVVERVAAAAVAGASASDASSLASELPAQIRTADADRSPDTAEALQLLHRLIFVKTRPHADWLHLLRTADVVLDTYPFGGCTSTYESLLVGTPVVSTPSRFTAGRFTRALLFRIGQHGLTTRTDELAELPSLAVSVAADVAAWDVRVERGDAEGNPHRAAIMTAARMAAADMSAVHEWTRFLVRAVAAAEATVAL